MAKFVVVSLSISLAVDTGRSQFDNKHFVACFVDKHCYELRRSRGLRGPVSDPCSGDLQELDLTRADLRRGHSHLHWASVQIGGVPPGKRQNEEKMLGTSAKQDDEKNTYSCSWSSPSQRRVVSQSFDFSLLPFPQAESRDCDARIFTRPAPRLV